ncbi:hypothetical protein [Carnobacterium sp. ISL-102]|uniref:hypothetical protein n=1 Tax=Carnobacterium TaxID=2747 RepID=UPI001BEA9B22|nr:hypothetical protein [Carnobacterium sp. ISL-102]MBT2732471.1 hypothetical protein [Carnobacterium sp. ISL-102]
MFQYLLIGLVVFYVMGNLLALRHFGAYDFESQFVRIFLVNDRRIIKNIKEKPTVPLIKKLKQIFSLQLIAKILIYSLFVHFYLGNNTSVSVFVLASLFVCNILFDLHTNRIVNAANKL